jgi:DNA-binding NtrC family response regulator
MIEVPAWSSTTIPIQAANTEAARPPARGAGRSGDPTTRRHRPAPGNLELAEAERCYARAVLERAGGNQSDAAHQLGISRNKLAVCSRRDALPIQYGSLPNDECAPRSRIHPGTSCAITWQCEP